MLFYNFIYYVSFYKNAKKPCLVVWDYFSWFHARDRRYFTLSAAICVPTFRTHMRAEDHLATSSRARPAHATVIEPAYIVTHITNASYRISLILPDVYIDYFMPRLLSSSIPLYQLFLPGFLSSVIDLTENIFGHSLKIDWWLPECRPFPVRNVSPQASYLIFSFLDSLVIASSAPEHLLFECWGSIHSLASFSYIGICIKFNKSQMRLYGEVYWIYKREDRDN